MVNDLELPAESISLEQQLETMKLELLRTQARLHHWQETSVAEAAFLQLRSQYFQAQYELWVMKACVAWARGEVTRLTVMLRVFARLRSARDSSSRSRLAEAFE